MKVCSLTNLEHNYFSENAKGYIQSQEFNNILLYINNRIGQQVIPTYMKSSPYKIYT